MNKLIIILITIFFWLIFINNINNNLCDDYNNQIVTATRVPLEGGEVEYGINGDWIKETELINKCGDLK